MHTDNTLKLQGPLTIEHIQNTHTAIQEALSGSDTIRLDLSGVTRLDVTGLQLLCALNRTLDAKSVQLNVLGLENVLAENSDILNLLAGNGSSCASCLWKDYKK